jgi:DnaJ domain
MATCYQVLGVIPPVSMSDLKLAYRKAAALHHPDRGGNHEAMIAVNNAYEQAKWEVESGHRNYQKPPKSHQKPPKSEKRKSKRKAKETKPVDPIEAGIRAIDKLIKKQVQNGYKPYWVVYELLKVSDSSPPIEVWRYLGARLRYHPNWYRHQADKWQQYQQTKDDPVCPDHPYVSPVVLPSGNHHAAGLRCGECDRWLKWLGKDDYRVKEINL